MKINIKGLGAQHKGIILKVVVKALAEAELDNLQGAVASACGAKLESIVDASNPMQGIIAEARSRGISPDSNSPEFKDFVKQHPAMIKAFADSIGRPGYNVLTDPDANSPAGLSLITNPDMQRVADGNVFVKVVASQPKVTITTEQAQEYLQQNNFNVGVYRGPGCHIPVKVNLYFGGDEIDLWSVESRLSPQKLPEFHAAIRQKFSNAPERLVENQTEEEQAAAAAALDQPPSYEDAAAEVPLAAEIHDNSNPDL